MKSATRRAANVKHLWDMHMTEEYIQRKFSKGDGMCRCGEALETSAHVLHDCSCEANSLGREQMTHKIHGSIQTLVAIRAITPDWSWFLTRMFSLDKNVKTKMWAQGTPPPWSLEPMDRADPRVPRGEPPQRGSPGKSRLDGVGLNLPPGTYGSGRSSGSTG